MISPEVREDGKWRLWMKFDQGDLIIYRCRDRIDDETPRQWNETTAAPTFHNIDLGAAVTNTRLPDYGVPTTRREGKVSTKEFCVCDACARKAEYDKMPKDWIAIWFRQWKGDIPESKEFDFCSWGCLVAWAQKCNEMRCRENVTFMPMINYSKINDLADEAPGGAGPYGVASGAD